MPLGQRSPSLTPGAAISPCSHPSHPGGAPQAREPSWTTPKRDLQTSGEQGPDRAILLPCRESLATRD